MVNPSIAAEKISEHAECFYQSLLALRSHLPVHLPPKHLQYILARGTLDEPLVVLDALTSELFLKCLVLHREGQHAART